MTYDKLTIVFGRVLTEEEFSKLAEYIDEYITEDYIMTAYSIKFDIIQKQTCRRSRNSSFCSVF